jgi:glutathione peroxidase
VEVSEMKKTTALAVIVIAIGIAIAVAAATRVETPTEFAIAGPTSLYEFTLKDIDGKDVRLENYKGKVLLIVNVASRCGFTPQYEGLEKVYNKYKDQGFLILGFPANNFMGQEPGTNEEIKQFCSLKYNVTFPMFAKISVKGEDKHPLYRFLTDKQTDPEFSGEISWNFNKFLVDRGGKIVARFASPDKPESDKVIQAIEKALSE